MNGGFYGWSQGQANPGLSALASVGIPPAVYAQMPSLSNLTSGSPNILPWAAIAGHVIVVIAGSADQVITSVSMPGVTWFQLCGGRGGSPDFASLGLWMGLVTSSGSSALTLSGTSLLVPFFYAFEMSALVGHADTGLSQINTSPISVSPSVLNPAGACIAGYYARSGTISGPTEGSPWVALLSNVGTGGGTLSVAWRPILAVGIIAATFTGRTDSAMECLGTII